MTTAAVIQPMAGASPRRAATLAGAFYLLTFISGISALFVRGRAGIMLGLAAGISYIAVTLLFYALFKAVNRKVSLLAACVSLTGILNGPLCLYHLSPFRIHSLVFFGCYCLLLSFLIYRSLFLTRFLAFFVALAGLSWLTFLFPTFTNHLVTYIYAPGVIGEGALMVWLLAFGIDEQAWLQQGLRSAGRSR